MKKYLFELPADFKIENKYFFTLFCGIAISIAFLTNSLLVGDELYYNFFSGQMSANQIEEIVITTKKWEWAGYALLVGFYLLKFLLISICLTIGLLLSNYAVPFKRLFFIVMSSELIFLVSPILKIFWFWFFQTDYTLTDLQYFSPLSLLSLINRDSIEPWLVYPAQLVNIFEVAYWLLLAYGLCKVTGERFSRMFELVASSYGLGLLLWTVFIVFLTVNADG